VLSRVTAQNQSSVAVPNETNQIKQLSSVQLAGFINYDDCAFRQIEPLQTFTHRLCLSETIPREIDDLPTISPK
jgi:hypothetical protein